MIVPFSKQPQQPQLPKVPEQYLLAALGQAHAEGKFHVYDPRVAQNLPSQKDEWKRENWNSTWEDAIPYGKKAATATKEEAIKQVPKDKEWIDKEGTIYTRKKPAEALTS